MRYLVVLILAMLTIGGVAEQQLANVFDIPAEVLAHPQD
jgi:hypothetical protein